VPRWADLAAEALAEAGRALIYQFGVGLGYLATVRHDGGPRIHPVCPIVANDGLYVFLIPPRKRADLLRDPRYALHTNGPEKTDDEFYVTGQARRVSDTRVRTVVAAYHVLVPDDHELFELEVDHAMHAKDKGHGDWPPIYTRWPRARRRR
jgi:pyridoxamine 5'-phosphate oxidase-like protein